jgi:NAD(P)-dependent dehydrogenase (short-subunit alcohol dehydrogenase family)
VNYPITSDILLITVTTTSNMQSALHSVVGPRKELHDLSGRTAVVTGGANGIGFQISRQFAQAKAKVIMVNRKEDQGDEAIKQIKDETPGADVDWVGCDLGNLKEVKQVFTDLRNKLDRLDLVSARQEVDNPPQETPRLTDFGS